MIKAREAMERLCRRKEITMKWKAIEISGIGAIEYICPYCGRHKEIKREFPYCPYCGKEIKRNFKKGVNK